ncbi:MAG: hypothetical protein E4H27_09225 [Anaerolineales bacterium]|nr:MAG: hypothetical protein E4H27_09225 [Anaerolineales bacterium]
MRNFALLNAYKNKAEAMKAWNKFAAELEATGYSELVQLHHPPQKAGYRQIAQCIAALAEAYEASKRKAGEIIARCPECGSTDINQYNMPYGPMWCMGCGFRVEEKNDQPNPFLNPQ